jgi:hypothetical protein
MRGHAVLNVGAGARWPGVVSVEIHGGECGRVPAKPCSGRIPRVALRHTYLGVPRELSPAAKAANPCMEDGKIPGFFRPSLAVWKSSNPVSRLMSLRLILLLLALPPLVRATSVVPRSRYGG